MPPVALTAALVMLLAVPVRAEDLEGVWAGTSWGEPASAVARHFGSRATVLPRPLDFGDSYVLVVVRDFAVGGVPLIVFYQMDKTTQALKRIQLERPRHSVTPAAFRGVLAGLEAAYGSPDLMCGIRPSAASGYQAAVERVWSRRGMVIRAIFRDTTLEALDGCFIAGSCGLTAQLLLRISPPRLDSGACPLPGRRFPAGALARPRG